MSDSDSEEDNSDRKLSGRKNKHHVFPKSRVKQFPKAKKIKKNGAKKVAVELHDAFHNLFHNNYTWEVIKKLKRWAQEQRPGSNTKNEEPFFTRFTVKQNESFVLLFDCQPFEFRDNGHLSNAIMVVENDFYADPKAYNDIVKVIKSKKGKKH